MTTKLEQSARQALEALIEAKVVAERYQNAEKREQAITALREALDHSADAGNKVSDHIADAGKVIPQFIPVGIVNDQHSITWMEEIVEDQAPIGAILYALQDGAGRNVSFAEEQK